MTSEIPGTLRNRWTGSGPWLTIVEETMREAEAPAWEGMVPDAAVGPGRNQPRLAGVVVFVDLRRLRDWIDRLSAVGRLDAPSPMARAAVAMARRAAPVDLFRASLCEDLACLREMAWSVRAEPDRFRALAGLVPVPLLQACGRRLSREVSAPWTQGYCPLCGSWPALAEEWGVERCRQLRCARCGSAWRTSRLTCPFCSNRNHDKLTSLVPAAERPGMTVEACRLCLGYLKVEARLEPAAPRDVMLDDMSSADLDVAALDEGFRRPAGPAFPLDAVVRAV